MRGSYKWPLYITVRKQFWEKQVKKIRIARKNKLEILKACFAHPFKNLPCFTTCSILHIPTE